MQLPSASVLLASLEISNEILNADSTATSWEARKVQTFIDAIELVQPLHGNIQEAKLLLQRVAPKVIVDGDRPEEWLRAALRAFICDLGISVDSFRLAYLGSNYVIKHCSENERQSLKIAGLLSDSDASARWWHEIQQELPKRSRNSESWFGAEMATYERERLFLSDTPVAPTLMSIRDSMAGYDILTWRQDASNTWEHHYIEVKSTTNKSFSMFYLSRNEFEFAGEHRSSWQLEFYIPTSKNPLIMCFGDIEACVPRDSDVGKWIECQVVVPSKLEG
jgi:hypothetical protein